MTPRGTDWSLAVLVALLGLSGLLTIFAGRPANGWVFALHGVAGFAAGLVLVWKGRRVWRRVRSPRRWDRRTARGLAAALLVALALLSGWAWASGGDVALAGFSLLAWHDLLGVLLVLAVAAHALARAKRPRRRDVAGRRQLLASAGVAAGAFAVWRVQRPLSELLGLPGARRRYTGSYEADSYAGNAFPTTSWLADAPHVLDPTRHRVAVVGAVRRPLALSVPELDAGHEVEALLDCTGGFHSTQRWRGTRLAALVARAGPRAGATHVRVVSHTGYRWSFPLAAAGELLLATHVTGEPLSHGHGAPVRLVAPGHRGFEWVKWVVRVELHDGPDPGAFGSTVWSSFTPEGRGTA